MDEKLALYSKKVPSMVVTMALQMAWLIVSVHWKEIDLEFPMVSWTDFDSPLQMVILLGRLMG
jgi:hypothetical protein